MSNKIGKGQLIPLKTALEVRARDTLSDFYVTRVPVKQANSTLNIIRAVLPEDGSQDFQHLRRFVKLVDLPESVRDRIVGSSADTDSGSSSSDGGEVRFLLAGSVNIFSEQGLIDLLSPLLTEIPIWQVRVPLVAPTTQEQAIGWSQKYWPTVYKKTNSFGPHPSLYARAAEDIGDVGRWMNLAREVGEEARGSERGEGVGVVVVERKAGVGSVVAVAGDARWEGGDIWKGSKEGNVSAHATMRAIGIVAASLRNRDRTKMLSSSADDIFRDEPLGPLEKEYCREIGDPDGYLCHELELYCTHEPCVMCSMAIVHSRFAKVVFEKRMPRTGGICADGELGHGLFYRKELNWNLLAWHWVREGGVEDRQGNNLNA